MLSRRNEINCGQSCSLHLQRPWFFSTLFNQTPSRSLRGSTGAGPGLSGCQLRGGDSWSCGFRLLVSVFVSLPRLNRDTFSSQPISCWRKALSFNPCSLSVSFRMKKKDFSNGILIPSSVVCLPRLSPIPSAKWQGGVITFRAN